MFQATNSKMPASTASGMCSASGAATSTIASSVSACTMPATGDVAPARMLVTVRAMVPVAGMPPKNGTIMLAAPWAISSWLGSCFLWCGSVASWSATRAHSSDSMAPSNAMVSVGVTSSRTVSHEKSGSANTGSACGMPPKREPMVSTGNLSPQASRLSTTSATTGAGTRANRRTVCPSMSRITGEPLRNSRGQRNSSATHASPSPNA